MSNSPVIKDDKKKFDLSDSPDDTKHLEPDEGTLDLPDVNDIPGQEHVRPIPSGEMADTTISSSDEEGEGIMDTEEDEINMDDNTNVSKQEKELLKQSSESMSTEDDLSLRKAEVDATDDEGVPLNESQDLSGDDLDVPGSEEDDA